MFRRTAPRTAFFFVFVSGCSENVPVLGKSWDIAEQRPNFSLQHRCCCACAGTRVFSQHVRGALWAYFFLVFVSRRVCAVAAGPSLPSLVGTRVLWMSCRDPRACPDAQDGIKSERQPVLVCCLCRGRDVAWGVRCVARGGVPVRWILHRRGSRCCVFLLFSCFL